MNKVWWFFHYKLAKFLWKIPTKMFVQGSFLGIEFGLHSQIGNFDIGIGFSNTYPQFWLNLGFITFFAVPKDSTNEKVQIQESKG